MSEIKLRGPQGAAGTLSWRGQTYSADKAGAFTVPAEAHADLKLHGFEVHVARGAGKGKAPDAGADEAAGE